MRGRGEGRARRGGAGRGEGHTACAPGRPRWWPVAPPARPRAPAPTATTERKVQTHGAFKSRGALPPPASAHPPLMANVPATADGIPPHYGAARRQTHVSNTSIRRVQLKVAFRPGEILSRLELHTLAGWGVETRF